MTDRRTGTQDHESPQVGTHGSAPTDDVTRTAPGDSHDRADERQQQPDQLQREMQRGGQTKEPQPSGTMPLERDQRPINRER